MEKGLMPLVIVMGFVVVALAIMVGSGGIHWHPKGTNGKRKKEDVGKGKRTAGDEGELIVDENGELRYTGCGGDCVPREFDACIEEGYTNCRKDMWHGSCEAICMNGSERVLGWTRPRQVANSIR